MHPSSLLTLGLLLKLAQLAVADYQSDEEKAYVKSLPPFPEAEFKDITKKDRDGKEVKAHYYGFGSQSSIYFHSHEKFGNVCVKTYKNVADGQQEVEVLKYLTAKRVKCVPRFFAIYKKHDFLYGTQMAVVLSFEGPWHMKTITYSEVTDEDKKELIAKFSIRRAVRQLLRIVADLHYVGVLHRDIKLDNIVIKENHDVALIDFALATFLQWGQAARGVRGTMYYTAPEAIIGDGQSFYADVWSVGCVLIAAYEREMDGPFHYGSRPRGLYGPKATDHATDVVLDNIIDSFKHGLRVSDRVPDGAYNLAQNYLLTRINCRSTAEVAYRHPWLWENSANPPQPRNSKHH